jgi:hypothetical protein
MTQTSKPITTYAQALKAARQQLMREVPEYAEAYNSSSFLGEGTIDVSYLCDLLLNAGYEAASTAHELDQEEFEILMLLHPIDFDAKPEESLIAHYREAHRDSKYSFPF